MDIKQLRTFLHVAELGKLSLAAERLHIAQPALSRQIKMLEEELGLRLFDRHGRGMVLTDAGGKLLERASFLLRYLEETRSEIQSYAGAVRGKVVVSMPETLAEVVAAELIENFVTKYPETLVQFVTGLSGYMLDWLQSGQVDVAVLYGPQSEETLLIEEILDEELHLVFKPGFLPGSHHRISFEEISKLPLVLPAKQHGLRALLEAHAKSMGLSLNVLIETDSFRVLTKLAARGQYATVLPARAVRNELAVKFLEVRRIEEPAPHRTLCIALPLDRPITTAVRLFSEDLKAAVRNITNAPP